MAKAVLCPVCEGTGKVPAPSGEAATGYSWKPCQGCEGVGWVEVSDK